MNINASMRFAMHLVALVVFLFTLVAKTEASTLVIGVKKTGADEYITGAKVCVGSASSAFMYGVVFTGASNQPLPTFEIPNNVATVSVIVTKDGYQGLRQTVSLSRSGQSVTRQILLRLTEGSGGPTCNAVPAPTNNVPVASPTVPQIPIAINSFQINSGQASTTDRIVRLDVTYSGVPTHYQVSESVDFAGASWKAIPGSGNQPTHNFDLHTINVPTSGPTRRTEPVTVPLRQGQVITRPSAEKYGQKTLHFRLKNAEFTSGKRSDTIELKPKLKRYYVNGAELKELVNYAKDQGFTFNSNVTEGSNNDPCFNTGARDFAGHPGFQQGFDSEIAAMKVMAHAECDLGVGPKATVYVHPKKLKTTFFGGRDLNAFWRIKGNPVFERGLLWNEATTDSSWSITKLPANHDPSFIVEFSFTRKAREYPVYGAKDILICKSGFCDPASIRFLIVELEGPEEDNWIDPNRKWKNAFRQQ